MSETLYDDGRYRVTRLAIITPRRIYPIGSATISVRRDPLWIGALIALLTTGTLGTYGDLLTGGEFFVAIVVLVVAPAVGAALPIMRLDAPGHAAVWLFAGRARIAALFAAIGQAQAVGDATFHIETESG